MSKADLETRRTRREDKEHEENMSRAAASTDFGLCSCSSPFFVILVFQDSIEGLIQNRTSIPTMGPVHANPNP
jgi:hypothetical protein